MPPPPLVWEDIFSSKSQRIRLHMQNSKNHYIMEGYEMGNEMHIPIFTMSLLGVTHNGTARRPEDRRV